MEDYVSMKPETEPLHTKIEVNKVLAGEENMKKIDLTGEWKFRLDPRKEGISKKYYSDDLEDTIYLPGTTAQQKKGEVNPVKEKKHLTETYHFEGYAWYSREIIISDEDRGKMFYLNLERTRKSYVWIDNDFVGHKESFSVAHEYNLSSFLTGILHKITILVSNTDYKTPGGHMTSPDTQTNWNGILGDISLCVYDQIRITNLQIYPYTSLRCIETDFEVLSCGKEDAAYAVVICRLPGSEDVISEKKERISLQKGENCFHLCLQLPSGYEPALWNEFTPNLYQVSVHVQTGSAQDTMDAITGFRDLRTEERDFYLNDLPVMLRGKHDGMVYPLTGYAPMDKDSWKQTFRTALDYGINHYRFHTCCPPKAAFEAADDLGIYLEPELPFWGTVAGDNEDESRIREREYLFQEGLEILRSFGNHPSFLMFSLGNELWGDKEIINGILGKYREADPRHWYTQGSNNFQFAPIILENDDFFCGVRFSENRLIRGSYAMCDAPLGHVQTTEPETRYCYDENICQTAVGGDSKNSNGTMIQVQYQSGTKTVQADEAKEIIPHIPVISHEIGQYEIYPDYREIEKYTGVLQPENLRIFKKKLEEKGLLFMAGHFFYASGKLAVACYKRELEAVFRSRELSGFQILDLQDFPGQGTALVGILNAFMENKGIISSEEWRQFCSDQVIMLSFDSHIKLAGQILSYDILFSNMNPVTISNAEVRISLRTQEDEVIEFQTEMFETIGLCRCKKLGHGDMPLPVCETPQILTIRAEILGTDICNHYEIYVYPEVERKQSNTVAVTNQTDKMKEILLSGGNVLFFGTNVREGQLIPGEYCTDFWCYPMFASISESMGKKKPAGTMGLYINRKHSALREFPTEEYTTPQWWKAVNGTPMVILDDTQISPIVWMIDNFDRNHKLGFLYEAAVGRGKLLVCQADLSEKESQEEIWLFNSLITYAESEQFQPQQELTFDQIDQLYE